MYRTPERLNSRQHLPSWFLLAFAAGATNSGAYFACQRFVSHVTGTVSRIGMDINQLVLAFDYIDRPCVSPGQGPGLLQDEGQEPAQVLIRLGLLAAWLLASLARLSQTGAQKQGVI